MAIDPRSEAFPPPTESVPVRPTSGSLLRWLVPALFVLAVAMVIVWATVPKKAEVYNPPPPPPKTVAEARKQIEDVKKNKNIPESQKGRILGFLQADLEKAEALEKGAGQQPQ